MKKKAILTRETFRTSRLLEYFSEKELTLQTGHEPDRWPLVVLKELIDNSLDACEEHDILPDLQVTMSRDGALTVSDNGPGLSTAVIESILDFSVRVSSKDAYISPTRGAQGNALKTVVAIPYVLQGGQASTVTIASQGQCHAITIVLDRIEQAPAIDHHVTADPSVKTGTRVTIPLPRLKTDNQVVFLPLIEGYSLLNPHASFTVRFGADVQRFNRTATACRKWRPSDPTSAHWYTPAQLRALMAAYVTAERRGGPALTVRDFIGQFKGLSSTVKRKAILARLPKLAALSLGACVKNGDIDEALVSALLGAMREESKPINPLDLGILGQSHLQAWLAAHGGVQATITCKRIADIDDTTGLPFVFEFAFGARQDNNPRRIIIGINAAPTLTDPFRTLKTYGLSLDGLLNAQHIGPTASVTCVAHLSCPHLHYIDRGKGSLEAL